ncbi:MAG: MerR family transcriptional regulator [Gammaproteobacteria bacterium]
MPQSQHAEKTVTATRMLPIRTVATLTGINPVTLRAWERRYNLITPQRTPKGHRLYSEDDVERIKQVLDLLDQGVSISQVKPLLGHTPGQPATAPAPDTAGEVWKHYQDSMLRAIENFDEHALESAYNDALSLYPADIVNQRLTTPLMQILGARWKESDSGIAEEHFFSVYLRNKLGARIHHLNQRSSGPQLLLACLPGEFHDIGLLFFAQAVVNFGYRVIVLGANTPLEQLPGVLKKRPCTGVVLSFSSRPSRGVLEEDLRELVGEAGIPVFVGGNTAIKYQKKIEAAGAICLGETLGSGLKQVSQTLNKQRR